MAIDAQVPVEEQVVENNTMEQEGPVQLTISGILEDLSNGLDREKIGEKYGLEKWEVAELFKHPKLKAKKAKKVRKVSFVLEDDTKVQDTAKEEEEEKDNSEVLTN